jgi:hypothetical protein
MRGFLQPAVKTIPTESQKAFGALSRSRRTKVAKVAHTTLVKADQWARGDAVTGDVSDALEQALKTIGQKKKK